MFFNKLCAVALFFNVMGSALFSVQEFKCDKTIIPGAVFFTVHKGTGCILHQAFDAGTILYDPSDCTESEIVKHNDSQVFISYHDGFGKIIGFIEVKNDEQTLISNILDSLDPQAKPQAFMAFIMEDLELGHRDIIFEGYGGEILSAHYEGKADINDPAFKAFEKKLDLTNVKKISVLTLPTSVDTVLIN
jgi:hypothetical protein